MFLSLISGPALSGASGQLHHWRQFFRLIFYLPRLVSPPLISEPAFSGASRHIYPVVLALILMFLRLLFPRFVLCLLLLRLTYLGLVSCTNAEVDKSWTSAARSSATEIARQQKSLANRNHSTMKKLFKMAFYNRTYIENDSWNLADVTRQLYIVRLLSLAATGYYRHSCLHIPPWTWSIGRTKDWNFLSLFMPLLYIPLWQ